MRWAILTTVACALAACSSAPKKADPVAPVAPIVIREPVEVKIVERVFVPVDNALTRPIATDELQLWQCPLERDTLRVKLKLANERFRAIEAIEGTKVKP